MDAEYIDEALQSRQLAVYGRESMRKLRDAHILIVGVDGLGTEIAKNVILANVKAVTLCDTATVQLSHLSAHFYLTAKDVGRPLAQACAKRLQELNPSVKVSTLSQVPADLDPYSCVVAVGVPLDTALQLNDACRLRKPAAFFIRCAAHGLFGTVFTDFGDEFVVHDVTGEQAKTAIVSSISQAKPSLVTCVEDDRLDFEDGEIVRFTEVEGMTELNAAGRTFKVNNVKAHSFELEDTTSFSAYKTGGIVTQVKQPKTLSFKSLRDSLSDPGEFLECDWSKFGRPALLHLAFRALDACKETPVNGDELLRHAKEINEKASETYKVEVDEGVLRQLARMAHAIINPMAAIIGGIVGQEVVKSCTSKFHPIHQWLNIDSLECLPAEPLSDDELAPKGCRYDDTIRVFGRSFQEKLGKLKLFVVGAGALGCEFMKNFAMLGISSGGGSLTITDDDMIERSNLTRQFLFRNWNVGHSKSVCVREAIKQMNNEVKIKSLMDRVSPDTENVFNEDFWGSLDVVCNALDNVKARLYVDSQCVRYGLPLLESGTLGTKCNVQVVVPHMTENYGATRDPPEKEAPQCVLHNFPHTIDHCLPLARSEFVGHFETIPYEVNKFMASESAEGYLQSQLKAGSSTGDILDKLRGHELWGGGVYDYLTAERIVSYEAAIHWARHRFEEYFVNRIIQLTAIYPRDATTRTGAPFWTPPKRFPEPLVFDVNDPLHMQFIIAASILHSRIFGIVPPPNCDDHKFIAKELAKVTVPKFVPSLDVKIETEEDQSSEGDGADSSPDADMDDIRKILAKLPTPEYLQDEAFVLYPEEFEKDDDYNSHMDFVSALGNLRARNYGIAEVDKLQAKLKAGRIIPAIATTTAMATGFVCLELCKLINKKPLESFRNLFANLALPLFAMSEPVPPMKVKSRVEKTKPDPVNYPDYEEEEEIVAYPERHTVWDHLHVDAGRDLTLQEFVDYFKEEAHGELQTSSVSVPATGMAIYNSLLPHTKDRLPQKLSELLSTVGKLSLEGRKEVLLECTFTNAAGTTVETPSILYKFC